MAKKREKKREIKVVETASGKVVHVVDVTGKDERQIEKVMYGMLRNMDTDRFHVDEGPDEPEPSPVPNPGR